MNEIAQSLKQQKEDSKPGSLDCESDVLTNKLEQGCSRNKHFHTLCVSFDYLKGLQQLHVSTCLTLESFKKNHNSSPLRHDDSLEQMCYLVLMNSLNKRLNLIKKYFFYWMRSKFSEKSGMALYTMKFTFSQVTPFIDQNQFLQGF